MNPKGDWLEQTWEIKRRLAAKYAGVPPSEQVNDMRKTVLEEWRRRGWVLREARTAALSDGEGMRRQTP